jgi:hypothetical protein
LGDTAKTIRAPASRRQKASKRNIADERAWCGLCAAQRQTELQLPPTNETAPDGSETIKIPMAEFNPHGKPFGAKPAEW